MTPKEAKRVLKRLVYEKNDSDASQAVGFAISAIEQNEKTSAWSKKCLLAIKNVIRNYDIKPHCGKYLTEEQCSELSRFILSALRGE